MLSTVTVTGQPSQEPVDLQEAKRHCRIDYGIDSELLISYITAARMMVEAYLGGAALLTQTFLWTMTPENSLGHHRARLHGEHFLPRFPVQTLIADAPVVVTDTLGNVTDVPAAQLPIVPPQPFLGYMVDLAHRRGRIAIGPHTPMSDGRQLDQIELLHMQIGFTAGYGNDPSDVPMPIKNAILLTTAFLYENRGDAGGEPPRAAQWLCDPYRLIQV